MAPAKRADVIAALQTDILRLQGFKTCGNCVKDDLGLGIINHAFPNGTFPMGAVHEFLSAKAEDSAAACGFITALLSSLIKNKGALLWISPSRTFFPPALINFGVQPDRVIFIDAPKDKDVMGLMEEALKCSALTAVVGEMQELSFTASRRLQLAVEQSNVTGFILRRNCKKLTTTACVSRWKITSFPGESFNDLPGIGFPTWRVELLRIRNGKPGVWKIQWMNGRFNVEESLGLSHALSKSGHASSRIPWQASLGKAG